MKLGNVNGSSTSQYLLHLIGLLSQASHYKTAQNSERHKVIPLPVSVFPQDEVIVECCVDDNTH